MEGEFGTVLLDVGDFEGGLRRTVGEVGVGIGRRAKGGTLHLGAEIGSVDVTVFGVDVAPWTENPVLVRATLTVEESIGEHAAVVERHRIVPSGGDEAGVGNSELEGVLLVSVFEGKPLGAVDGRLDVVAVAVGAGAHTIECIVAAAGNLYRVVADVEDLVFVDGCCVVGALMIVAHHVPRTRRRNVGVVHIVVEVWQVERVPQLVAEHLGGEVAVIRTFELEVESVGPHAVDCDRVVDGVVGKILHVGPQY